MNRFVSLAVAAAVLATGAGSALAAPVSASGLYTFRDNNFGLVAGPARDIIVIGAWDPVPGAQAGTTGTATQIDSLTGSLVIVPLVEQGYTANPAALENITPYSPGLTGAWTYDLQNGGDSTQLTGPVVGNVGSMPLATHITVTGTGPTPTVSWDLPAAMPAGVEVDWVQVFVWERDATEPDRLDLLHLGPLLSPTQTSYEIPLNLIAEPWRAAVPSLSMEAGRNYTIAVGLIDGNALNFQLTRSLYGVHYAPVPVPEPSRLVMLAAGLGVVVAAGRHTRRSGVHTHRA